MEGRKNKDAVLLTVIGIATLLVAIVGATFAFFTARITDNDNSKTLTITSASGGSTTYTGGNPITVENIYPREAAWVTKPIMITYTNTNTNYAYTYKLQLNYTSTFNPNQLTYELSRATGYCTDGTSLTQQACTGTWETTQDSGVGAATAVTGYFSSSTGAVDLTTGTFASQGTNLRHAYLLKIYYPDSGANQNYAQGDGTAQNTESNVSNTNQGQSLTAWVAAIETTNS